MHPRDCARDRLAALPRGAPSAIAAYPRASASSSCIAPSSPARPSAVAWRNSCSSRSGASPWATGRSLRVRDERCPLARERLGVAGPAVLHRVRERARWSRSASRLLADLVRPLAVDVAARAPRVEPRGVGLTLGERLVGERERAVRLRLAPGRLIGPIRGASSAPRARRGARGRSAASARGAWRRCSGSASSRTKSIE